MTGTCAIYVLQSKFDVEKKHWVQTSSKDVQKIDIFLFFFRDIHGANYLFENGVAPSIPCILP